VVHTLGYAPGTIYLYYNQFIEHDTTSVNKPDDSDAPYCYYDAWENGEGCVLIINDQHDEVAYHSKPIGTTLNSQ
jgi:hypothetical protein